MLCLKINDFIGKNKWLIGSWVSKRVKKLSQFYPLPSPQLFENYFFQLKFKFWFIRSELHCIFVNTETWTIFCHECNKDIFIDSHKKLYEAVEFIKKIDSNPSKHMTKTVMPSMSLPKLTGKELKDQTNVAVQAGQLPKER